MANESPLVHWGWGKSGFDARNSTYSGTTRGGLNGSGQFLAVQCSTTADLTVNVCTVAGMKITGILQNKPSTGIAADVGIFGVSKAVAGSSAIAAGQELMVSSTTPGALIPYATASGQFPVARSLEAAGTVGQLFSALIYGGSGPVT